MRTGTYLLTLSVIAFLALLVFGGYWQPFGQLDTQKTTQRLNRNEVRLDTLLENRQLASQLDEQSADSQFGENNAELLRVLDILESGATDEAVQVYLDNLGQLAEALDLARVLTELLVEARDYERALTMLYEQRLFISEALEADLMQLIFAAVERSERELSEVGDLERVVSLFRLLISLHADHIPYHLRLAHWLLELGDADAAAQTLAGTSNDTRYSSEREALLERLESGNSLLSSEQVIVPLRKVGEHYIADVTVDDAFTAAMMIDTGATLTVLKASLIGAYATERYNPVPLQMNTANGVVSGSRLLIPQVALGNAQIRDVEVGSIPLPDFQFDGLLGMNILGRYRFRIDHDQELLYLGVSEPDT